MSFSAEPAMPRAETNPAKPQPAGVLQFSLDAQGFFTKASPGARMFFGLPAEGNIPAAVGWKGSLASPAMQESFANHFAALGSQPDTTTVFATGDGRWMQMMTQVQKGDDGKPDSFDTFCVDVTETVRATERKDQKEVADARMGEQVANRTTKRIIHDIRKYLATMSGYAEALTDGGFPVDEEFRTQSLRTIRENTQHAAALISGYTHLMDLENGAGEIELMPVQMGSIVMTLQKEYGQEVYGKKPTVTFQQDMPIPMGIGFMVQQTLDNLISNAVKYGGDAPEIAVRAISLSDGTIRYEVHDRGPGIPPERLGELFQERGALRLQEQKNIPSLGLGLDMVRQMVELQGGKVGVESEVGYGSTFYFILDAAPQTQAQSVAENTP